MIWLALAIAIAVVVASIVVAVLRGLEAFRDAKRLAGSAGAELDRIATATGEIERHLALAAESGTRLDAAVARLQVSRARLNVLTTALADVSAAVGRVTAVYPRK
jgi:hypothetical protein